MPIICVPHRETRLPDGGVVQGGYEYRVVSWRAYVAHLLRRLCRPASPTTAPEAERP